MLYPAELKAHTKDSHLSLAFAIIPNILSFVNRFFDFFCKNTTKFFPEGFFLLIALGKSDIIAYQFVLAISVKDDASPAIP